MLTSYLSTFDYLTRILHLQNQNLLLSSERTKLEIRGRNGSARFFKRDEAIKQPAR